jgi:hypothetical protein
MSLICCLLLLSAPSLRLLVSVQKILAKFDLLSSIGSGIDRLITEVITKKNGNEDTPKTPKADTPKTSREYRLLFAEEVNWKRSKMDNPGSIVGCFAVRLCRVLKFFDNTPLPSVVDDDDDEVMAERILSFVSDCEDSAEHTKHRQHCLVYMDSLRRQVFGFQVSEEIEALVGILDLASTRSNLALLRLVLSMAYHRAENRFQITRRTIPWINVLQRRVHQLILKIMLSQIIDVNPSALGTKLYILAPLVKEVAGALVMCLLLYHPLFADPDDDKAWSSIGKLFPPASSFDAVSLSTTSVAGQPDDAHFGKDCLTVQFCTLFNCLDITSLMGSSNLTGSLDDCGFTSLVTKIYRISLGEGERTRRKEGSMEGAMKQLRVHLGDVRTGGVLGALLRKAQERESFDRLGGRPAKTILQLSIPRGGKITAAAPVLAEYDEQKFGFPEQWSLSGAVTLLNRSLQLMLSDPKDPKEHKLPWPESLAGIVCLFPNNGKSCWKVPHVIPGGLKPRDALGPASAPDLVGDGDSAADAVGLRSLYFWVWHEKPRMLIPVWLEIEKREVLSCSVFCVSGRDNFLLPKTMKKLNDWLQQGEFR